MYKNPTLVLQSKELWEEGDKEEKGVGCWNSSINFRKTVVTDC